LLYGFSLFFSSVVLKLSGKFEFTTIVYTILFFTWVYSAPPLRLKRHMVLNNLAIATPRGALGILAPYTIFGNPLDPEILVAAVGFAIFVFGANISKDFRDEQVDKTFGVRNFVTAYGSDSAAKIMTPFLYLPIIILAVMRPVVLLALPISVLLHYIVVGRRDLRAKISWHLFYVEMGILMLLYTVPSLVP